MFELLEDNKADTNIFKTAHFQKIKKQFLCVMSIIINVDLTMFVEDVVIECTLYILIYISE